MTLRILHLDHTSSAGGAEFALLRLLRDDPPWIATLFLPKNQDWGVYQPLVGTAVSVKKVGPGQTFGASKAGKGLISTARFALSIAGQAIAVRRSQQFRDSQVVHTNTSRAAVYGALACMGTRKRLVVHLRDILDVDTLGAVGLFLLSRISLARADGVIANSRATLASAKRYIHARTRTTVLASPAGLVRSEPQPAPRKLSRVGMVARIDPWKGQDLLIRSFAEAFRGSPTRLLLAGGSPFGNEAYLNELRRLVRSLDIEAQVDFLGHVDDVHALIQSLDVCVQASMRPEPLGQNVLQYLAASRPVIASNAGGPAEWIQHGVNGLLFEIGSWESLADALARLRDDHILRNQLAAAAGSTAGLASDAELVGEHKRFFDAVAALANQGVNL